MGRGMNALEEATLGSQVPDTAGGLRLVQLRTPMRFDPTAAHGGFLGGLTSRLMLQLYIGEAY